MKTSGWIAIGLLAIVGVVLAGAGLVTAQTAADADFDGSGDVGFQDFLLFAAKFNTSEGDAQYEAKFDIDGNGSVGFTDFLTFARFFGETVPEPVLALTGVAPVEGMPGTLIELLGQFDVNTNYQVKFDTVLLPVFAQSAERISVMVPVLPAASLPVRVVEASGKESDPLSFEVLALPEPRMDAAQLRETVADVGTGIANVIAPLTRSDVIFNDAGAALFNQEMGKLNAAWDVLGQRIEALPPQDAAMLAHLLDNSGALEILEALGQIDLSASKLAAQSSLTHNLLFRVDIVSAIIGYASDLVMVGAIASAVAPEPLFTKAMTGAMGGISTLLGVLKSGIDTTIPTDLQGVSKVEIDPTPVPLGGASDVAFYGTFETESNLLADLGAFGVGKGMEEIVKLLILKRKGKAFLDELLENETLSNAVDEIVGFFSGILSDVGFGVTGLENLFENVAVPRYDEPLDMSLYTLSLPSIIKWIIPPFPAEEIDKMAGVLEKVGIDLVSESVAVVNRRDEVNREVAEYDPVTGQLKGHRAGEMRLKMRAFRFVEPGGGSGDEPEDDNRGFFRRVWDRAVNVVKIPLDLITNLHPVFRFSNSMDRLPPVYLNISVGDTTSGGTLVVESIRRLTHPEARDYDPTWSPDGRHIAFTSERDGNLEIYVMDSEGGNPRNLTKHESPDTDPAWSRDGRHIAFTSGRDGNGEIYVMGSDGSNPRRLTNHSGGDRSPSWSLGDRYIAFASNRDSYLDWTPDAEIYVMGSDGRDPRRLTNHSGEDTSPSWSPDGRHIAFASDREGGGIYVMGSDGSNPRNLTEHEEYRQTEPAWSPDGRHIAFVNASWTQYTYRFFDIYVTGSDGSKVHNLTLPSGSSLACSSPAWSPDGRYIAFVGDPGGSFGGISDIYVIKLRDDSGGSVIAGSVEGDQAALAALYRATNGPGWRATIKRFPWLSENPLYDWYGVATGAQGRVRALDLSDMELSGPIPKELGNLTDMEVLDLSRNQLTGPLPKELGNLTNLRALRLSGNQLTGPIPKELGNLTDLLVLDLSGNQLTVGPIPEWLGNLTYLRELNLSGTQLTGPIPKWLGNLTNLRWLTLVGNQLTGPIPEELGNLTNLTILELHHNQLTGPIPKELGNLTKLWIVKVYRNQSLCMPADFPAEAAFYRAENGGLPPPCQ